MEDEGNRRPRHCDEGFDPNSERGCDRGGGKTTLSNCNSYGKITQHKLRPQKTGFVVTGGGAKGFASLANEATLWPAGYIRGNQQRETAHQT